MVFVTDSHFHPNLIFTSKNGTYHSGAFPENIGLGWKLPVATNALACNTELLVTDVKGFIIQVLPDFECGSQYYKTFYSSSHPFQPLPNICFMTQAELGSTWIGTKPNPPILDTVRHCWQ